MAREPEAQRQRGEVVGVSKLFERACKTKLSEIPVKRYPFNAPEDVGEIRWGSANGPRNIGQAYGAGEVCL
jgi:hypothetical protein